MKPRIWWNRTLGCWMGSYGGIVIVGPTRIHLLGIWLDSLRALAWDLQWAGEIPVRVFR
jgi:hypothetical protein